MWSTIARQKNSYLHHVFCDVNPCILDRSVNRALKKYATNPSEYQHPFNQPASLQPCAFGVSLDDSKTSIAFGAWEIPQLIKEICDCDPLINFRAVNRLTEELKDSTKCYEAIQKNITFYLCKLLKTYYKLVTAKQFLENICLCLEQIAIHLDGALTILINPYVFDCLYYIMRHYIGSIDIFAAFVLIALGNHQKIAEDLVLRCHLEKVMTLIQACPESLCFEVYEFLSLLIERDPPKAIEEGFFGVLFKKLPKDCDCQANVMKCFAYLINCECAQTLTDRCDAVYTLYKILKSAKGNSNVIRYTVLAMQNAILSTKSKWRCREFYDLPYILLEHAHTRTDSNLQLFAIQALKGICEMPSIKEVVRKLMKGKVKKIFCLEAYNHKFKESLIEMLQYKNYKLPKEKNFVINDEYELACDSTSDSDTESESEIDNIDEMI